MKYVLTLLSVVLLASLAQAQQFSASLSGADTLAQGSMLQLTFRYENIESAPAVEVPQLVGFTVVGGPSVQTQLSVVNGVRTSQRAYVYSLVAEQPGLALIPAVSLEYEGETLSTEQITRMILSDPEYVPLAEREGTLREGDAVRKKRRPTVRM